MTRPLVFALACLMPLTTLAADDLKQRAQQSRALIKELTTGLKGQMKGTLEASGPVEAIKICKEIAPTVIGQHAKERGWEIGRTSLKPRNPNNAPDAWETTVLEKFEARNAAGEDPKKMEFYEVVEANGQKAFRYMKAIPTAEKPCLLCHGSKIKPEVATVLEKHYPKDKALGYKGGEIRGAFSISQPMQ